MGNYFSKKEFIENIENEPDYIIPFNEKIPKDEFLCPKCKEIPEVLDLHLDYKKIDFKCKICNKININSKSYQSKPFKKNYLFNNDKYKCPYCGENSKNNEDNFFYCYDCKYDFCEKCKVLYHEKEEKTKEHIKIIKTSEKKINRCLDHYNENYIYFCEDCRENICKESISNIHKFHKIIKLNDLNEKYRENIDIIKKKNQELLNIIKFNKTIINCFNKQKNNYLYLKSLENISNAYKKEKERDSNNLKFILNDFDKEIENSEKVIEEISDDKSSDEFEINREKENLILSEEELNDENLKCISKIKFNNLKEINLSENKIINIDLLSNISLPYLELLNLSYNQIINIEPLGQINSRKLKYLFIQNNQIEDFQVFFNYDSNFNSLYILRLEENKIKEDSDTFKELEQKYNNKVISNSYVDKIKRKYNIIYDENDDKNEKKIQINNTKEGDSVLRELFKIISHKNKNRITKLNLNNNIIVDPSLLNRIQFDYLEELDLSANNIKSLDFLKGMKAKKLEYLYLDNNNINDLSPLKNDDFENVFDNLTISLKNNNFDEKDPKISKISDDIKEVNEAIKLRFE